MCCCHTSAACHDLLVTCHMSWHCPHPKHGSRPDQTIHPHTKAWQLTIQIKPVQCHWPGRRSEARKLSYLGSKPSNYQVLWYNHKRVHICGCVIVTSHDTWSPPGPPLAGVTTACDARTPRPAQSGIPGCQSWSAHRRGHTRQVTRVGWWDRPAWRGHVPRDRHVLHQHQPAREQ